MNRREFLKKSLATSIVAAVSPLMASPFIALAESETKTNTKMKKIMIIDGGPRKTMNTAQMTDAFVEGIKSVSEEIEVKRIRLYGLEPYRGCMSCMACKVKGRLSRICKFRDPLLPVLQEASEADGLVVASPIYMADRTALTQAFVERIVFPWLNYADGSVMAVKKMPVAFIYTMNATEEQAPLIHKQLDIAEQMFGIALGETERIEAFNTYQMKDYSRYEFAENTPAEKQAYKDEHWSQDLQKARDAGRRMAEKIIK